MESPAEIICRFITADNVKTTINQSFLQDPPFNWFPDTHHAARIYYCPLVLCPAAGRRDTKTHPCRAEEPVVLTSEYLIARRRNFRRSPVCGTRRHSESRNSSSMRSLPALTASKAIPFRRVRTSRAAKEPDRGSEAAAAAAAAAPAATAAAAAPARGSRVRGLISFVRYILAACGR